MVGWIDRQWRCGSIQPTNSIDPIDIQGGTSRVSTIRGSSRGTEIPALLPVKIEEIREQKFLVELKRISRADTLKPTYLHNQRELEAARNYCSILKDSRIQQDQQLLARLDIQPWKIQRSQPGVTAPTGVNRSQGTNAQPLEKTQEVKECSSRATQVQQTTQDQHTRPQGQQERARNQKRSHTRDPTKTSAHS